MSGYIFAARSLSPLLGTGDIKKVETPPVLLEVLSSCNGERWDWVIYRWSCGIVEDGASARHWMDWCLESAHQDSDI